MPELAGRRVRFAVLHTERFTSPPRVIQEHYPVLVFDVDGHVDAEAQRAQLGAEVDRLETSGYAPMLPTNDPDDLSIDWCPDDATRRRLFAATAAMAAPTSYHARMTTGVLSLRAEDRRPRTGYPCARDEMPWQAPRWSDVAAPAALDGDGRAA